MTPVSPQPHPSPFPRAARVACKAADPWLHRGRRRRRACRCGRSRRGGATARRTLGQAFYSDRQIAIRMLDPRRSAADVRCGDPAARRRSRLRGAVRSTRCAASARALASSGPAAVARRSIDTATICRVVTLSRWMDRLPLRPVVARCSRTCCIRAASRRATTRGRGCWKALTSR